MMDQTLYLSPNVELRAEVQTFLENTPDEYATLVISVERDGNSCILKFVDFTKEDAKTIVDALTKFYPSLKGNGDKAGAGIKKEE